MPAKVLGVVQFHTKIKNLDLALRSKSLGQILMEASQVILDEAVRTVRGQSTRTGELARGLAMELQPAKSPHEATLHIGADKSTFYSRFVEKGTKFMRPEPFLLPALESNRNRVMTDIQDRLTKEIERAGGGE